jgi:bleomycin hydrolase
MNQAFIEKLQKEISENNKYKIVQSSLRKASIKNVSTSQNALNKMPFKFNIELKDTVATNQYYSGRCWIFAGLNILRYKLIDKYKLPPDFELSEAYIYKHDKFEKCNTALELIYNFAKKNFDNQSLELISLIPKIIADGGTVLEFVNIINKYGIMPKESFPDIRQSKDTDRLNNLLNITILKTTSIINSKTSHNTFMDYKTEILKECYRIITLCLGNTPIEFEWKSKLINPINFYKKLVKPLIDLDDYICIVNDPRNKYNVLLSVEYLHNVVNNNEDLKNKITNKYLNIDIKLFKKAVYKTISKYETPVWFATDYSTFVLNDSTILDHKSSNIKDMFDVDFVFNKETAYKCGITVANHAMCIVGCQKNDNKYLRWKVENSHGTNNNLKGFLNMSDAFFDQFMVCAFVHKNTLPIELRKLYYSNKNITYLPFYDILGTYAD